MLSRYGYIQSTWSEEHTKTLTVRPLAPSPDYPQPPPFKVYRRHEGSTICVPRFFGCSTFGPPKDVRPDPVCVRIQSVGHLRQETNQPEAFRLAKESLETLGGAVVSLPCGFGKTRVALEVASHFKVRVMVLVHKEFLAAQWREAIQKFCPGSSVGLVQGDACDTDKDFVICMIQTLSQRPFPPKTFDSVGLLIVDECHHICARVFSQCMFKLCPRFTLGLSATPIRRDGLTNVMHWFLGPTVLSIQRSSDHVQVIPVHFSGPFPPVAVTRTGNLSLPAMITELTRLPERNQSIADILRSIDPDRHTLILTDRREHAHALLEMLGTENAGLYIGGMKPEELDESAAKRFVIGTFSLAQEGLDIPSLDTAIFATPKADVIQAAGRILRKAGGTPIIYDIVDQWSVFYGMFRKRLKQYDDMRFSVLHRDDGGGEHKDEYKMYRFDD